MLFTNKKNTSIIVVLTFLPICLIAALLVLQQMNTRDHQLSVKPPSQFSKITLESVESTLGLQIRFPYNTLKQVVEKATADPQTGEGKKQTCKRLVGLRACATLLWQYQLERSGEVKITRGNNTLQLQLPLSLEGAVTVDGRGGKLLGLRNKEIQGQLELIADIKISVAENWCPVLKAELNYSWLSDPKIKLVGKLKINLRKSADKALLRKLQKIEQKFADLIDCSEFRTRVTKQWKVHYLPIKISGLEQSYLELTPQSVAVSNATPMEDHLSTAFEIIAHSKVTQARAQHEPLTLPKLMHHVVTPGTVEFSLLFKLTYDQMRGLVSEKLLDSSAPPIHKQFTITSFDLYPSNDRLIFDLGFQANGYGRFFQSSGNLFLSAKPVADPESKELRFEDLQFTRIIDNDLWSVFSTVLHNRILEKLRKSAVIDLSPQLVKLEQSLARTLSNPKKTAGLIVHASPPKVNLVAVNPQASSLAAILHVSTRLEAEVPPAMLFNR